MTNPNDQSNTKKSPGQRSAQERYQRYKSVIECIREKAEFQMEDVKLACQPEQTGFVTRVIKELEQNGWLLRESDSDTEYRWNHVRGEFKPEKWLDKKIYGDQIPLSPAEERPRERLLAKGVEQLKTSELLAILIRSGRPGESAVSAGKSIAAHFQTRLTDLPAAGRGELNAISRAVNQTAYCQIMAGIELGRRVSEQSHNQSAVQISSSQDAIRFCQTHFLRLRMDRRQEEFHIVTLDTKNHVIDTHQITVGILDASLVHPREVFRPAIKDAASSILLVHNHPSGDPTPSQEDFAVTRRLEASGKTLGIDVLDHVVLGNESSVSLKEQSGGSV